MKFYLGTHKPNWLWFESMPPLFVSRRTLTRRVGLSPTRTTWALDSGGFSELSLFGEWRTSQSEYISEVTRWHQEIGNLDWAAPQDWMCEPIMLQKTGKTVTEHQSLTIQSYLSLKATAPSLPFIPVLQGWAIGDYVAHVRAYEAEGVALDKLPTVGLGSVCRRQGMDEAHEIVRELSGMGLSLHGFGVKLTGLRKFAHLLKSADSLAWSYGARRSPSLEGCVGHKNCANCLKYALLWNGKIEREITQCESLFSS